MLRWQRPVTTDRAVGRDGAPAPPIRRVLACALDAQQRARLAAALSTRAQTEAVATFDGLRALLKAPPRVAAVVVGAREPGGESARRIVRELAQAWPTTPIVVYCHTNWRQDTDIRELAASGAHQFVFAGVNDGVLALRAALATARRQSAAERVMHHFAPIVPAPLHHVVEVALTRADAVTEVSALAAALGVHRKTLFNMCRRAKFLGPAELLVWVRLALAAYLLETTRRSIERLANELAYPSPNALRNAFRRRVGRPPSEVRSTDGLQAVLDAFARRVSAHRSDSVARGVRAGRRTTR